MSPLWQKGRMLVNGLYSTHGRRRPANDQTVSTSYRSNKLVSVQRGMLM